MHGMRPHFWGHLGPYLSHLPLGARFWILSKTIGNLSVERRGPSFLRAAAAAAAAAARKRIPSGESGRGAPTAPTRTPPPATATDALGGGGGGRAGRPGRRSTSSECVPGHSFCAPPIARPAAAASAPRPGSGGRAGRDRADGRVRGGRSERRTRRRRPLAGISGICLSISPTRRDGARFVLAAVLWPEAAVPSRHGAAFCFVLPTGRTLRRTTRGSTAFANSHWK